MKKEKKLLAMILALAMVLPLAACNVTPPATQLPGSTPVTSAPLPSGSTPMPSQSVSQPAFTLPSQPEGFEIPEGWIWCSSQEGALVKNGYYSIPRRGSTLQYFDFASAQSVVLCEREDCYHTSADCNAYIFPDSKELFFYQDRLYYFHLDGTLRQRNALGKEEAVVGAPGKAACESGETVRINRFVLTGTYLYYQAQIKGSNTQGDARCAVLGRIELSSGKDAVLIRQEITDGWTFQNVKLCAAQQSGMLFYESKGIPVKNDDPELVEKSRDMKVYLKQWNAETGEVTTLMEKTRQDFLEVYLVDGGKVYFGGMDVPAAQTQSDAAAHGEGQVPSGSTDGSLAPTVWSNGEDDIPAYIERGEDDSDTKIRPDVFSYDLSTGQETVFREQAHLRGVGGGYAVLVQDGGSSIVELKTGKAFPITGLRLPYVNAVSSDGVVLTTALAQDSQRLVWCYVPFAAQADGLTEDDLLIIHTDGAR